MYGTPKSILQNILDEKGLKISDLYSMFIDFKVGEHTYSPFKVRNGDDNIDSTPSLLITEYKGILTWKDFGLNTVNQIGSSDAIGFVQQLFRFKDRSKAMLFIIEKLLNNELPAKYVFKSTEKPYHPLLSVQGRDTWKDFELAYWDTFGVSEQLLQENSVYPLEYYKVNGTLKWESTIEQPKFLYIFHDDSWQIYNPFAENKKDKFRTNNIAHIVIGYNTLPTISDGLLITKSMKDILVWKSLGAKAVVAPMNEVTFSALLARKNEFDNRFKNIYILFDGDATGIMNSKLLAEMTGWNSLLFDFPQDTKDSADVIKAMGKDNGGIYLKKQLKNKMNGRV